MNAAGDRSVTPRNRAAASGSSMCVSGRIVMPALVAGIHALKFAAL